MAIDNVSLTAGMFSNLASLQNISNEIKTTQEQLSTGKKVNSALDNPLEFFTAQSLNGTASTLAGFQDGMSNAVQTIQAANNGITAITSLISQAQAIAQSAVASATGNYYEQQTVSLTGVTGTVYGTGQAITVTANVTTGDTVTVGGLTFTAVASGSASATQFVVGSGADAAATSLSTAINDAISGGALGSIPSVTVTATNGVVSITSSTTNVLAASVSASSTDMTASSVQTTATAGSTVTIGGVTFTALSAGITAGADQFNVGATDAATAQNLQAAITAALTGGALGSIANFTSAQTGNAISLSSSTNNIATASITTSSTTQFVDTNVAAQVTPRETYRSQFSQLLNQITTLAQDSGYNGTNLLNSATLNVQFGSSTSDVLGIQGFDASAAGLSLSAGITGSWSADNVNIDAAVTSLNTAQNTLNANSGTLSSGLTIINTRQTWANSMINTLQTGANNLVLADENQEGANMLMLQTQQSLATTALSLSSQAAQSVLKLFP
jgi:flagellin